MIELFDQYCPKACENFRKLCCGFERSDKLTMSYNNSEVSRMVPGLFVQMGDISKLYGKAKEELGFSFWGKEFEDESFEIKHEEPGLLGMCHRGGVPHSNEC